MGDSDSDTDEDEDVAPADWLMGGAGTAGTAGTARCKQCGVHVERTLNAIEYHLAVCDAGAHNGDGGSRSSSSSGSGSSNSDSGSGRARIKYHRAASSCSGGGSSLTHLTKLLLARKISASILSMQLRNTITKPQ